MDWCKNKTIELISLWESQELLYNVKHPDYRDRKKKKDASNEIAATLGTTQEEVEKKMHTLKCQFNREFQKEQNTTSGKIYCSNWYAYNLLKFLKEYNRLESSDDLMESNTNGQWKGEHETKHHIRALHSVPIHKKMKRFEKRPEPLLSPRYSYVKKDLKDEFTIYGENVASELRQIKNRRKLLVLKKTINDLIFDTSMDDELEQSTSSLTPNSSSTVNTHAVPLCSTLLASPTDSEIAVEPQSEICIYSDEAES